MTQTTTASATRPRICARQMLGRKVLVRQRLPPIAPRRSARRRKSASQIAGSTPTLRLRLLRQPGGFDGLTRGGGQPRERNASNSTLLAVALPCPLETQPGSDV